MKRKQLKAFKYVRLDSISFVSDTKFSFYINHLNIPLKLPSTTKVLDFNHLMIVGFFWKPQNVFTYHSHNQSVK